MPNFEVRPFDISAFPEGKTGYLLDGMPTPWNEIKDPTYATVEHVMLVGEDGVAAFPKINVIYNRGVFITTVRVNPERGVEVLLIDEERPLVRDDNGNRGHVMVTSVPQGIIKNGETYVTATDRLLEKEVGHKPDNLTYLGEVFLDAANSETAHDFCLVEVPFSQEAGETRHDPTEVIQNRRWLTPDEIVNLDPPLTCAKALSGIELSRKHFPRLMQRGRQQQV